MTSLFLAGIPSTVVEKSSVEVFHLFVRMRLIIEELEQGRMRVP
jgi:hypothetical protein